MQEEFLANVLHRVDVQVDMQNPHPCSPSPHTHPHTHTPSQRAWLYFFSRCVRCSPRAILWQHPMLTCDLLGSPPVPVWVPPSPWLPSSTHHTAATCAKGGPSSKAHLDTFSQCVFFNCAFQKVCDLTLLCPRKKTVQVSLVRSSRGECFYCASKLMQSYP